ncbi:MAG: ShlB/FhaC/HecB family hemolysin secretion/activation protein [Planctomycetales bacterium]|nr:ShlB/FhaC/HecB family hemolysin secretion/activation protein [Planctomycetales bacterium]
MCHQFSTRDASRGSLALAAAMLVVGLIGCGFGATRAFAQELDQYHSYDRYRYLPRLPGSDESPAPLPPVADEVGGDSTILVESLRGLIFVDDPADVTTTPLALDGVTIQGPSLTLLDRPEFRDRVADRYLGGAISLRRMNELVRDTILFYRRHDRPVVDVSIPEQDITDGYVQVVVTEARIGKIRVQGANYFDAAELAGQLRLHPGGRIHESQLQEELRWLYRNPYRTVDLELTPGQQRGKTDVIFNVHDRMPVRLYAGYEDTGNRALGLERTFYGVNWFDAFHRDDYLGYQYTASSDFNRLGAHSGFYTRALDNRDLVSLYGSYAEFESPIAPILTSKGVSWQLLGRWYRELYHDNCQTHAITAGVDIKQTNTNLDLGGVLVAGNTADIVQMMIGYVGRFENRRGSTSIGLDGYYSPGHLSGGNVSSAFQTIRPLATANYFYARGFAERRIDLPHRLELVGRFTGQWAEGNLLPTEQIGLGGYNSVRSYDLYSVVGDSGYFTNIELWTGAISTRIPSRWCRGDELRFLAFYDFGSGYDHTAVVGRNSANDLQGIGVGMRYEMQPNLTVRADYGWQITDLGPGFRQPNSRAHIGVVWSH